MHLLHIISLPCLCLRYLPSIFMCDCVFVSFINTQTHSLALFLLLLMPTCIDPFINFLSLVAFFLFSPYIPHTLDVPYLLSVSWVSLLLSLCQEHIKSSWQRLIWTRAQHWGRLSRTSVRSTLRILSCLLPFLRPLFGSRTERRTLAPLGRGCQTPYMLNNFPFLFCPPPDVFRFVVGRLWRGRPQLFMMYSLLCSVND